MVDIVSCILMYLLGPDNFHKGIEYLKTLYDIPSLLSLLRSLSVSEASGHPVIIDTDLISRGMEELKRLLDLLVDRNQGVSDEQRLSMKMGNDWFVEQCYQAIKSRCVSIN